MNKFWYFINLTTMDSGNFFIVREGIVG